jgi:hypothetical protein
MASGTIFKPAGHVLQEVPFLSAQPRMAYKALNTLKQQIFVRILAATH